VDTTAPVISNVAAGGITATTATITWATDENSDSQVEYGPTTAYGQATTLNTALVTAHSQGLSGLTSETLYHYRVKSRDAAGNLAVSGDFTFTTADNTAPVISNVAAVGITTDTATITWTTNENSDSQVEYGTTTAYGQSTALNPALMTAHLQVLSGLTPGTLYHYRVKSKDAAGNLAVSGDFTFTTAQNGSAAIKWLVTDHLGSTRIVIDETGSLAGITRHDFLPFGEELSAGVGIRSAALGYGADSTRQKFTGYERDDETGLDFAEARYFGSVQGRFTSVDPLMASGMVGCPQSWNRYAYAFNNPLRYTDPTGMLAGDFYDEEGRRIGTDGQNDGRAYLVTDQAQAEQIRQTDRARGTTQVSAVTSALELPSQAVRQEIGSAALARSNRPTGGNTPTDDREGRFHEEGGIVVQTQNGQLAVPARPGPVSDPAAANPATIDVTNAVNPNLAAQATSPVLVTTYHVHPAGERKERVTQGNTTTETTHFFRQPPSGADQTFAGGNPTSLGYHIVVGAGRSSNPGGQRVHFYNGNGVIGTMPLNRFVNIR
jgi:RHS repeat-associated protein